MRARPALAGILALVVLAGCPGTGRAADRTPCPVPGDVLADAPPLGAVSAAVRRGGPVPILAVGSASTSAGAWPRAMMEALQHLFPGVRFDLRIAGVRGMSTGELLPALERGLAAQRPVLVLWQTGTVDAVRGQRLDEMADALDQGAQAVGAARADLILVDSQFSRFLSENTDLAPYQDVLRNAGAPLFPRYALMEGWAENGGPDLEMTPPPQRGAVAAVVQACVGRALARFIRAGVSRASGASGAG